MYLYILQNAVIGKLYIGVTINIERRLQEHNRRNRHFTGRRLGTWKLLFTREFSSVYQARKEESRLKKSRNRNYLLWYIKQYTGR